MSELDKMIGIPSLKHNIVKLIFTFCRYMYRKTMKQQVGKPPMMGTILYGRPGVGKTTAAELLGNILLKLGILTKNRHLHIFLSYPVDHYSSYSYNHTKNIHLSYPLND